MINNVCLLSQACLICGWILLWVSHLVCEQPDETLGLSLQVQVHVEQLPVESLVDLLLALQPAGLLHGPLHALPVQVVGQAAQEDAHVLRVVEADAELAGGKARKHRRGETEGGGGETKKEKKQGYREVEGWGASVND